MTVLWIIAAILSVPVLLLTFVLSWNILLPFREVIVTMTSGTKEVVFLGMTHFASRRFFEKTYNDVVSAISAGATYYFEGVKPSPEHPDAMKKITAHLAGGNFSGMEVDDLYKMASELMGLSTGKEFPFKNIGGVNVDIDAWDLYQRIQAYPAVLSREGKPPLEADKMVEVVSGMQNALAHHPKLRHVVQILFRNLLLGVMSLKGKGKLERTGNPALFFRNEVLADAILGGPNRIIVTYGSGHIPGVLELLQMKDPRWTVASKKTRNLI